MRLTELQPRWCGERDAPEDARQGVSFLCPHCLTQRLAVWFSNPICSNPAVSALLGSEKYMADHHHLHGWARTGETFEDLTLSPSVDAGASGHWHGFLTGGEIK